MPFQARSIAVGSISSSSGPPQVRTTRTPVSTRAERPDASVGAARGSPPEGDRQTRQVSWLAGRHHSLAFPVRRSPVAFVRDGSPLTVAESAPDLPRERRTGFPVAPDRQWSATVTAVSSVRRPPDVNHLVE